MIYTSGSMNLHQSPRTSYEKLKIQEKLAQLILNEISQYTVHNNPEGKLDFFKLQLHACATPWVVNHNQYHYTSKDTGKKTGFATLSHALLAVQFT